MRCAKGQGEGAGGLSTGGAVLGVRVSLLVWAFGVAKDPDGKVFDVGGPLRRQLEKLDIVPLDAVDGDCREEQRDVSERRVGNTVWSSETETETARLSVQYGRVIHIRYFKKSTQQHQS